MATIPKILGEMSGACIDPFYLTRKAREYGLDLIRQHTPLIVDTRNVFKDLPSDNVVKA